MSDEEKSLDKLMDVLQAVAVEYLEAEKNFGPFASRHEGVAIIEEEFLEFREAAFWGHKEHTGDADVEVKQLAAMCVRYLMDLGYNE